MLNADDLGSDDAFEPVKYHAGAKPFQRVRPCGSVAQADGIVVPVGVAEPHHQTPRRLGPERLHELVAQQAHGSRAQDDHALLVKADDALVWAEIQHLGEVDVLDLRRLGVRRLFHLGPWSLLVTVDIDRSPLVPGCQPV